MPWGPILTVGVVLLIVAPFALAAFMARMDYIDRIDR